MLVRNPKLTAKQRERNRRYVREHRAREKKKLALHHVVIDGATYDLLVRHGYLKDSETIDWEMVNAALTQFLWDKAHGK